MFQLKIISLRAFQEHSSIAVMFDNGYPTILAFYPNVQFLIQYKALPVVRSILMVMVNLSSDVLAVDIIHTIAIGSVFIIYLVVMLVLRRILLVVVVFMI